jgi:hypothetical protein
VLTAVLIAIACAGALAGCGSSAKKNARSHSARASFLAFSKCMRDNGVSNFPDPASGGTVHLAIGMNPFSPSFKTAQVACRHLLPGGGPPTGPPSKHQLALALSTSECMRAHGVTGFPDPIASLPSNPDAYGPIEDRGGVVLAIPRTINVNSPAFQRAAKACDFN